MAIFNYKKVVSFVLIFVIAVATGFSVGKIYVDNLEPASVVSASEEDLREKNTDVASWVNSADRGTSASSFTAVQLFSIAEYKLYHADKYYKLMTGVVNAPMGINQQMRSEKLHNDGMLVFNKLSPSSKNISPSICTRMIYDYSSNAIKINSSGSFDKNSDVIKGVFDTSKYTSYTMDKYKEIFNSAPTSVMSYIISSITCGQKKISAITENSDGSHSFKISIDGDYLTLAALYYSYEIKFSSGMADPPKWVSLELDVTIDSNFNFKTIGYNEVYKMNVSGIGLMQVTDVFVDNFEFDNVPSIEEFVPEIKEVM